MINTCGPNSQNTTPLKSPVLHSGILGFFLNKKGIERQRKEGEEEEKGKKIDYFNSNALRCLTKESSKPRNILSAQTALWLLLTTYSLGSFKRNYLKTDSLLK